MTKKYKEIDGEAPDPLEFAAQAIPVQRQEGPAETGIPLPVGTDPMALALQMMAEALKSIQAKDAGATTQLDRIAEFLMRQEQTRPNENLFNPPMISHFNPLGERDNPRPELKCRFIYVGYELKKECLLRNEIELLNRLKGGNYRVKKADNRMIPFRVSERRDEADNLETITVTFPCKGSEDRQNHAPMGSYLRQVLGEEQTTEDLLAQVRALQTQVAAYTASGA